MTLFQILIIGAIIALLIVSAMHSVLGEKMLLGPLFARRGNPVLENQLARRVLRFAWHATSIMWVMMAVMLYSLAFAPSALGAVVLYTMAGGFLFCGVIDAIVTRFRHVGWSVLTAIGVFCLAAALNGGAPL